MDTKEQYTVLTEKLNENLPLKAYPVRELVHIFRDNGHPITLKTPLTITSVFNSGDVSGIMCAVELIDGYRMACALTHLLFSKTVALYPEIIDYQRKREKRIKQLKLRGLN